MQWMSHTTEANIQRLSQLCPLTRSSVPPLKAPRIEAVIRENDTPNVVGPGCRTTEIHPSEDDVIVGLHGSFFPHIGRVRIEWQACFW